MGSGILLKLQFFLNGGEGMLEFEEDLRCTAKIKVFGVGGGGGNAINTMVKASLSGVEFIAANTDVQALKASLASQKIQFGEKTTKGLGAGSDPSVGKKSALEDTDKILEACKGADMIFITAGMGGGTGTGAAPVIARIAKEGHSLIGGVVTKPFLIQCKPITQIAEEGIEELRKVVDSLIIVPNQRLLNIAGRTLPFLESFQLADDVLKQAVQGISDIIVKPGRINVDFADVRKVMESMGRCIMGTGVASGEGRAGEAAQKAISSPLLEDGSIEGAKGVLINITGGANVTLHEITEAASIINECVHEEALIILGAVIDERLEDEMMVTVIATGFGKEESQKIIPIKRDEGKGAIYQFHPENIEIPTYMRRKNVVIKAVSGKIMDEPVIYDENDLEVPAFLRRKVD